MVLSVCDVKLKLVSEYLFGCDYFVSDHCQPGTGFRFSTDAGFLGSTGPADLRTGQCLFCFVVYFLCFFVSSSWFCSHVCCHLKAL